MRRSLDGALNITDSTPRRVLRFGLTWLLLWAAFWTVVVTIIGIVHPDSIDPGEGPLVIAATLGPLGLLSGMAFGVLRSIWPRGGTPGRPLVHVASSGILATALVQLPYLGHWDVGLAANINMALASCAVGGVVTIAWLAMMRRWSHRRSSPLLRARAFALLPGVAAAALVFSSTSAPEGFQPNPCVVSGPRAIEPTLKPIDEAPRRFDFLEFRRRLQDAVARRDQRAVLASVHPTVRISFGDSGGLEAFRKEVVESRAEDFSGEFATILRLGGRFREEHAFDAPYTFSAWPAGLDAFECLAVIGTRVRVRAAPNLIAPVITRLDFAIVRALPRDGDSRGWRPMQLADGRTGYIASQDLRSPIDHRALFEFEQGQWWVMAYIAGD